MIKEFWLNLAVKDVAKSKTFFNSIGFESNNGFPDTAHSSCLLVGSKKMAIMLYAENIFKSIIQNGVTDCSQSNEMIISFDGESKLEVDEMAKKVELAGGTLFSKPAEVQGWMYGFAFVDLDGHRWNMIFMDMGKMPKSV